MNEVVSAGMLPVLEFMLVGPEDKAVEFVDG